MPPMKRPAAALAKSNAARGPKRVKVEGAEHLAVVADAIKRSSLPTEVTTMLAGCAVPALGTPKDLRHAYQDEVVGWIGAALLGVESSLQEANTAAKNKLAAAQEEKTLRENASLEKAAELTKLSELADEAAIKRNDAAAAKEEAESAVSNAQKDLEDVKAGIESTQAKKIELETAMKETFEELKKIAATKKQADGLVKVLKKFQVEPALLQSLSLVLLKPPEEYTDFDKLVEANLSEAVDKKVRDFASSIESFEVEVEKKQAFLTEASAKTEAAASALQAAEAAATDAKSAVKLGEASVKEAKKLAKEFAAACKITESEVSETQSALDEFKNGPQAQFIEFRDKTTPPPVEESVDEQKDEDKEEAKSGDV